MSIYLIIVALTLIFGAIMPQRGPQRKYYIILMTVIHGFVSAFRYNHLTGDLLKYHWEFLQLGDYSWFSQEVLHEGRNAGFYLINKAVNELTGGDFQMLLILISVAIAVVLAIVIYRYSPAPWMSYLIWNCMGFYIFGFSSIKQALAMAVVMLAFIGIAERKLKYYLVMMTIAGLLHTPSLIFLPAFWLARCRVTGKTVLIYVLAGVLMSIFNDLVVEFIMSFYYEEDAIEIFSGELGNRFIMILGFCLFGLLFKGFSSRRFEALFHIMAVAAILQMLSGFNNVFTRLTDYYFQFSTIYLPMLFLGDEREMAANTRLPAIFRFNRRSMKFFALLIVVFAIWFYYTYNINITIQTEVDNYLNFRFMWDVQ